MSDMKEQWKRYSDEVKAGLVRNIESFCEKWLSAGKKVSGMWHVGSPQNTAGDSLKIHLQGDHMGEGYYNRENRGIGPIDLWMEVHGCDFKEASKMAGEWLNIAQPTRGAATRPATAPGERMKEPGKLGFQRMGRSADVQALREDVSTAALGKKDFKDIVEGSRAWKYLTEERGLSGDALKRARIGETNTWMPKHGKAVDCWCIPFYSADGETLLNVKYFAIDRIHNVEKGRYEKDVRAQKGCEYHLIGMDLIDVGRDTEVVLCEGEADWLSCLSENIPALSVPFGAKADGANGKENSGNRWIRNDWDWLETVKCLILAFDADKAGLAGLETVKRRLPEGIIRKVADIRAVWADAPDGADVNDLYQRDPEDIYHLVEGAIEEAPGELATARDLRDEIWEKMFPSDGESEGYEVHGLGDLLRWRLGEWTIVTGYEGSGKTTWLGHQQVGLADQGVGIGIASLEANPSKSYHMMFQQALGCVRPVTLPDLKPDVARFERCVDWMNDRVFCYKKVGFTKLTEVLDLFSYLARRYGCRVFVIDSLMMLQVDMAHGLTANDREKEMAQLIKIFCERFEAHVFLVAHAKKAQDDKGQHRKPVRPQDIRGAGELANLPFNIVSIHLNDEKLYKIRDLREAVRILEEKGSAFDQTDLEKKKKLDEEIAEWEVKHDSTMYCLKQREARGDHPKPARRLWFHCGAKQLWHESAKEPEVYVD